MKGALLALYPPGAWPHPWPSDTYFVLVVPLHRGFQILVHHPPSRCCTGPLSRGRSLPPGQPLYLSLHHTNLHPSFLTRVLTSRGP